MNIIKVNWGEIILYDVKVESSYKFPRLRHWNHPNARCFFGRYAVRESFQYCLLQKDYTVCQVTVRISKFVSWKYLKIIKFCSKGSQGLCPCATSLASNKKAKWKCYSSGVKIWFFQLIYTYAQLQPVTRIHMKNRQKLGAKWPLASNLVNFVVHFGHAWSTPTRFWTFSRCSNTSYCIQIII